VGQRSLSRWHKGGNKFFDGTRVTKTLIFTRPKRGTTFAPTLSHVINKTRVVGSRVDGSNPPQTTNIVHAGRTICLGGTHVD
jgi:hypothetical protein